MRSPGQDRADGAARPDGEAADVRWDDFYRDQAPKLRRRLRARLGSGEDASDLVQDAFARLLGADPLYQLRHPEAFLSRIVRNLLIDRSRRVATRCEHVPLDEEAEMIAVPPQQTDAIEVDQMRNRFRELVATLPARMQEVFLLHRVEELSYKDIAARLGISVRTVEWHVAEAIIRISKGLEADEQA